MGYAGAHFQCFNIKNFLRQRRYMARYVEIAGRPTESKVCWDQRIAQFNDGRMINLFWAYDTISNKDCNIHASFAAKDGRAWSKPKDTGVKGQIACPVVLNANHIIMLYVRRDTKRQILARESFDGGNSWDESTEMCIHNQSDQTTQDTNLFNAMNEWSYGHPFGIKINDREIAVVFYAGQGQNTSLRFCKITV